MKFKDYLEGRLSTYSLNKDLERKLRRAKFAFVHNMFLWLLDYTITFLNIDLDKRRSLINEKKPPVNVEILIKSLQNIINEISFNDWNECEKYFNSELKNKDEIEHLQNFEMMLGEDYKEPVIKNENPSEMDSIDLFELIDQINTLHYYYGVTALQNNKNINYQLDWRIDYTLSRLIYYFGIIFLSVDSSVNLYKRIKKSQKGVKKITTKNQERVRIKYQELKSNRPKIIKQSINYVAGEIRDRFNSDGHSISLNTVKKYLKPLLKIDKENIRSD